MQNYGTEIPETLDVLGKNIQQQNVGTTIPKNRVAISAQLFVFQLFVCFSSGGVNTFDFASTAPIGAWTCNPPVLGGNTVKSNS